MRVSDQMLRTLLIQGTQDARARQLLAATQIATNERVSKPSDDPAVAARVMGVERILGRLDAIDQGRNAARLDLSLAESAITTALDLLGDAKALVLQMVNGDKSAEDRLVGADTLTATLQQLISLANSQQADGHYLFAGTADGTPPYLSDGTYQGNFLAREVEISPDVYATVSLAGPNLFGSVDPGPDVGTGAGSDAMGVLGSIIAALQANDVDALGTTVPQLDDVFDDLRVSLTSVGNRLAMLDQAEIFVDELRTTYSLEGLGLREADVTQAATELSAAETTLAALGAMGSQLLSSNLLGILG